MGRRGGKSPGVEGGLTTRQYQLLWLRFFNVTPEFVEHGPDGNGIPWDWWEFGCDLIDAWIKRGV